MLYWDGNLEEKTMTKGQKNYIKLFDEMERQDTYDEKEIKFKYKNEKFVNHIGFEKNYLQSMIMKTLRSNVANASIDIRFFQYFKHGF